MSFVTRLTINIDQSKEIEMKIAFNKHLLIFYVYHPQVHHNNFYMKSFCKPIQNKCARPTAKQMKLVISVLVWLTCE